MRSVRIAARRGAVQRRRPDARQTPRARRVIAAIATACVCGLAVNGCSSLLPRQYEYEEEVYVAVDGSATVYVNSSVPALVALRGLPLDVNPRTRVNRAAVRAAYTSDAFTVTRVSTSRRRGRRFVHVRLETADVRRLSEAPPFSWSTYSFGTRNGELVFHQVVGRAAGRQVGNVGWSGDELVAFRLHLPSRIHYHNAPSKQVERGNIVVWEQRLTDRLAGVPINIEVRLDTRSILYRTLWLFGLMIALVTVTFAIVILWIIRKGRQQASVSM